MVQQIYTDGVQNIAMFNNNVRVDLASMIPTENAEDADNPETELTARMVMSAQAFVLMYQAFENMIKEMESRGVIQRNASQENEVITSAKESNSGKTSPNFSN